MPEVMVGSKGERPTCAICGEPQFYDSQETRWKCTHLKSFSTALIGFPIGPLIEVGVS